MRIKDVEYVLNPSLEMRIDFSLRSRNTEMKTRNIDLRKDKGLSEVLMSVASIHSRSRKIPKDIAKYADFLIAHRLLVPVEEVPKKIVPEWKISADVLKFVPKLMRDQFHRQVTGTRLVFNSEYTEIQSGRLRPVTPHYGIPPDNSFPEAGQHLWVYDPGTKMWSTYKLTPSWITKIKGLARGGRKAIERLDDKEIEILHHARVLVAPGYARRRASEWGTQTRRWHSHLQRKRFVVIKSLIHPLQIAIMRRYYRDLEANGYLLLDNAQVRFKRFYKHNDPILQLVHRQSGNVARAVTGQSILPSYSFLSAYMKDAHLARHVDRPQCAWNASLLIDQDPEVDVSESWPIYLKTPEAVEEVQLDFGDALFYSGTELPHWRHTIKDGHRQTLGLLHYVPIEFPGGLD